jgi:hypothetical protein
MILKRGWIQTGLLLFLAATMALTAACGSSGSSPAPTPTPAPAPLIKGFWTGSLGNTATQAIILANGDTWVVFMESGVVTRFARMQTTTSANSFSNSGTQYLLQSGTAETGTATGTFTEKKEMSGTMTAASGSSSFAVTYDTRYDTVASLSDAAGTWTGSYTGNGSLTMTITPTGALSGTSTTGCSYNGSLQTRAADPAVFDLGFTETCPVGAAKQLAGIATVNTAKTALSVAVTTSDRAQGALFTGHR